MNRREILEKAVALAGLPALIIAVPVMAPKPKTLTEIALLNPPQVVTIREVEADWIRSEPWQTGTGRIRVAEHPSDIFFPLSNGVLMFERHERTDADVLVGLNVERLFEMLDREGVATPDRPSYSVVDLRWKA